MANLDFENVPLSKLESVRPLLKETLEKEARKGLDMDRMGVIVDRRIAELKMNLETDPHRVVAGYIVGDFLYSKDEKDVSNNSSLAFNYFNAMYSSLKPG